MSAILHCQHCQTKLRKTSRFCEQCGQPVKSHKVIHCPQCQHPLTGHEKFCNQCGMLLSIKVNTKPKERSLQNLKRPKTKFDTTYRRSQAIRIKLDFEKVLARVIKDHSIQPFRDFLSAIQE